MGAAKYSEQQWTFKTLNFLRFLFFNIYFQNLDKTLNNKTLITKGTY